MAASDYRVRRFTRRCAVADRPLSPGETYYSVILAEGSETTRRDIGADGWTGPPDGALGWWRAKVDSPPSGAGPVPTDVLLALLKRWQGDASKGAMRYLLALLLLRRRVLKLTDGPRGFQPDQSADGLGDPPLQLTDPSRELHRIEVVSLDERQRREAQERLEEIVYGVKESAA